MLFDVEKLIGFAAYIMKSLNVDSMKYIMLIKLMYLSDRRFVECFDSTISNDDFVSKPLNGDESKKNSTLLF